MSVPSPPRHLSPDPASPVRRRLFPPSPSSLFFSHWKINKWDEQAFSLTYVLRLVEMISPAHLIASWTESFFWKGWLMRWRGYHLRERGNKQDAGASKLRQQQIRSAWTKIFVSFKKKAKKEGGKLQGLIRGLSKKKKWKRGGSRSCFRQSQLIDRRIEWLFLLHFYSSPLHKRHPWQRSLPVNLFNCLVFPLSLAFSLCFKKKSQTSDKGKDPFGTYREMN